MYSYIKFKLIIAKHLKTPATFLTSNSEDINVNTFKKQMHLTKKKQSKLYSVDISDFELTFYITYISLDVTTYSKRTIPFSLFYSPLKMV